MVIVITVLEPTTAEVISSIPTPVSPFKAVGTLIALWQLHPHPPGIIHL
jgi:hypothetical protein